MIGDVILSFKEMCKNIDNPEKCLLILHTQTQDENGTDLKTVIEHLASDVNIMIHDEKVDQNVLNLIYNCCDVTINIASNEGFGLSSAESIYSGTMILNNVTGGLQDQLRFSDENNNWIKFDENFLSNNIKKFTNCGKWGIPIFPKTISLMGSIPTPYIFDDRCDWKEVAKKLIGIKSIPREIRRKFALDGREWMLSEESRMSSSKMNELIVRDILLLLENWKPKKPFELFDTSFYSPINKRKTGL
jgi:hypothetical protein